MTSRSPATTRPAFPLARKSSRSDFFRRLLTTFSHPNFFNYRPVAIGAFTHRSDGRPPGISSVNLFSRSKKGLGSQCVRHGSHTWILYILYIRLILLYIAKTKKKSEYEGAWCKTVKEAQKNCLTALSLKTSSNSFAL